VGGTIVDCSMLSRPSVVPSRPIVISNASTPSYFVAVDGGADDVDSIPALRLQIPYMICAGVSSLFLAKAWTCREFFSFRVAPDAELFWTPGGGGSCSIARAPPSTTLRISTRVARARIADGARASYSAPVSCKSSGVPFNDLKHGSCRDDAM